MGRLFRGGGADQGLQGSWQVAGPENPSFGELSASLLPHLCTNSVGRWTYKSLQEDESWQPWEQEVLQQASLRTTIAMTSFVLNYSPTLRRLSKSRKWILWQVVPPLMLPRGNSA